MRIGSLYECGCDDCKDRPAQLNLALGDKLKGVLNAGEKAFKLLHKKGGYKPEDLKTEKPYQDLIKKTFDTFSFAITDNDMPEAMERALQSDAFLLSSLKANAQLFEASKLLLNDDGSLKSFSQLSGQFDKLNVQYNQNYLDSEYQFAVSSSQSVAKWVELGSSERYNLQYRTAGDDRVRDAHKALANITLPKDDPFWESYTPPNGWKCRCTYVEVLIGKYDVDDSSKSITKGEAATTEIGKDGKNRLAIFRFNPGAQKVVFPPEHPYNKVAGASKVKNIFLPIFNKQSAEELKLLRKEKDVEVRNWAKDNIPESGKIITAKNFQTESATILRKNVKSISDHFTELKYKDLATKIIQIVKKCEFIESATLDESSKGKSNVNLERKKARGVTGYNYYKFENDGDTFRLNVEIVKGVEFPFSINKIVKAE